MSPEVLVRNEMEVARPEAPETRPQEVLNQVVDAVRRDSQQGSRAFLSETTVPHGGE